VVVSNHEWILLGVEIAVLVLFSAVALVRAFDRRPTRRVV